MVFANMDTVEDPVVGAVVDFGGAEVGRSWLSVGDKQVHS